MTPVKARVWVTGGMAATLASTIVVLGEARSPLWTLILCIISTNVSIYGVGWLAGWSAAQWQRLQDRWVPESEEPTVDE